MYGEQLGQKKVTPRCFLLTPENWSKVSLSKPGCLTRIFKPDSMKGKTTLCEDSGVKRRLLSPDSFPSITQKTMSGSASQRLESKLDMRIPAVLFITLFQPNHFLPFVSRLLPYSHRQLFSTARDRHLHMCQARRLPTSATYSCR